MALVAPCNGAQHADELPLILAEVLQDLAVLLAPPLLHRAARAHLHQDVVPVGGPGAVLVQVGLAQGGIADQARLHGRLGLVQAEVTGNCLSVFRRKALVLLPFVGQIRLHDAAQMEVILQFQGGPQLDPTQRAGIGGLVLLLGAEHLLDTLLAEAVTAAE